MLQNDFKGPVGGALSGGIAVKEEDDGTQTLESKEPTNKQQQPRSLPQLHPIKDCLKLFSKNTEIISLDKCFSES